MFRTLLRRSVFLGVLFALAAFAAGAQIGSPTGGRRGGLGASVTGDDAGKPKEYEIGGIDVVGNNFLDKDLLLAVTGLTPGQKIRVPGDDAIARAIRKLWKQELFADVRIDVSRIVNDKVFLTIVVDERPRVSRYNFPGIKPSEAKELKEKIGPMTNRVATEGMKTEAKVRIRKYFIDKGFGTVKVDVREKRDTTKVNSVSLSFFIDKGKKTHINQINFSGNEIASSSRLKRTFHGTKEMSRLTLHPDEDLSVYGNETKRSLSKYLRNFGFLSPSKTLDALDPYFRFKFFSGSKYNESKFEDDRQSLVDLLQFAWIP